ncbi:MAG: hypothetical protein PUB98_10205 [Clostridiales bacterium]|nr:hypothetical protein [Clostridiales bacterium]
MRRMKIANRKMAGVVSIMICLICMGGCRGQKWINDEVIMPDENTVGITITPRFTKEQLEEEQRKIEELNRTNKETGMEEEAKRQIIELFRKYGATDSNQVSISDGEYVSSTIRMLAGTSSQTNIVINSFMDTEKNSIDTYSVGPMNGSEYPQIVGIDKLDFDVNELEEALKCHGIYTIEPVYIESYENGEIYMKISGTMYKMKMADKKMVNQEEQ